MSFEIFRSTILYILINEKSTADYCKLQPLRESFSKNDIRLNLDVKDVNSNGINTF